MKRLSIPVVLILALLSATACDTNKGKQEDKNKSGDFKFQTEQFADIKILRYQVPGFEELNLQQKKLCYYLYEAAISGRDMIWDQNYKHNLVIRKSLENIHQTYKGKKEGEDWNKFNDWSKQVFFSNGIHHHYSTIKMMPEFSQAYFKTLMDESDAKGFPVAEGETIAQLNEMLNPIMFDANVAPKKVNKNNDIDLVTGSASNFYEGVTMEEVKKFYAAMDDPKNPHEPSFGLNSKVVKENGKLVEKIWKVGGMYDASISKIVFWLEKAASVAENPAQEKAIREMVAFYQTGELKKFDDYNIAWVHDTASRVDVVNGFIEVYGDPLGFKGSFESVVSIKDMEASHRIDAISKQAQWFEDNSPIKQEHKKEEVKGITAKVITAVVEAGDAAPSTPIGINLPNSNWIREVHGSKSVNLGNIVYAYDESGKNSGILEEFCLNKEEIELSKNYASLASNLHTDMHEVIGHASGKLEKGISEPHVALKNYASTLEEARADLVALYYIMDQKLIDIGVMSNLDVGKAEYNSYIRNGLMLQLRRVKEGEDIEEDHMRNRQLIAAWAFEKGAAEKVIEKITKENKTYFVINDYQKLRTLFGELLKEIQDIKSKGDFKRGQDLVETYGVKVDQALLKEVQERMKKLNIAPYSGFIQPRLSAVMSEGGEITDVKIEYPEDFLQQMLEFGKNYGLLPARN